MSKAPSDKTLLKQERARFNKLEKQLRATERYRDQYSERALKAEREVCEWKERFDALLARSPISPTIELTKEVPTDPLLGYKG